MTAAFVQEVAAGGTAVNGPALVLTLGSVTTTVGNHLILCVGIRAADVLVSVVDSKGNTWQIDKTQFGTGAQLVIASCKLGTALVVTDTITTTFTIGGSPASSGISGSVAEYSGLASASWFDKTAAAVGTTGTAADSGATSTTAQAAELLVGCVSHQSTVTSFTPEVLSPTWNANTTAASVGTVTTTRPLYRVVAGTGTYSAKATWTTSRVWVAGIATYKAAAAAGFAHSQAVIS